MNRTTERSRVQRIVIALASGVVGLAAGYLVALAIGAAPVLFILAGIALWFGAAALSQRTRKSTAPSQETSGVETLASL